ncbi:hypothetical protein [Pseudomonas chlororaphis]|uniref:hypothetical protein n=1 Tax=Pseudomonas chlororaphis TaxID=587753 RepID=UPI00406D2A46
MRILYLPAIFLTVAALAGCDKQPADGTSQAQLDSQMEMAGKLLRNESPRERKGGE